MILANVPLPQTIDDLLTGKGKINWEKFHYLENNQRSGTMSAEWYLEIVHGLIHQGVFTFDKNDYTLLGCGMILNPRAHILQVNFANKEDAEAYKQAAYGNAMYGVSVVGGSKN